MYIKICGFLHVYDLMNIFIYTYIYAYMLIYSFRSKNVSIHHVAMYDYQSSEKDAKIKSGDLFDLSTARASHINSIKCRLKINFMKYLLSFVKDIIYKSVFSSTFRKRTVCCISRYTIDFIAMLNKKLLTL